MFLDHREVEQRKKRRNAFNKWHKSCKDVDLLDYIDSIIEENKRMNEELKEYSDFFGKLSSFLPKKFSPHDIIG